MTEETKQKINAAIRANRIAGAAMRVRDEEDGEIDFTAAIAACEAATIAMREVNPLRQIEP